MIKDVHTRILVRSDRNRFSGNYSTYRIGCNHYMAKWKGKEMKQPKRLTRSQKECLSAHNLKPDDWMLADETNFYLKVVNKHTLDKPVKEIRFLDKFKRPKKGVRRNAGSNIAEAGN